MDTGLTLVKLHLTKNQKRRYPPFPSKSPSSPFHSLSCKDNCNIFLRIWHLKVRESFLAFSLKGVANYILPLVYERFNIFSPLKTKCFSPIFRV